jgi:hypothetical protein
MRKGRSGGTQGGRQSFITITDNNSATMNLFLHPGVPPHAPAPSGDADEEDLGDLPPLDGGDDDVEAPPDELDDVEAEDEDEDGADPFDDATGEGDPVEELESEADEGEHWVDSGLNGAGEAEELDVGGDELDGDEQTGLLDDAEEPGVGDEDFDLKDVAEALTVDGGVDGGEEGFEEDDEELREEDLPRLDADEDGEGDDEDFADPWPPGSEEPPPPWEDRAWERATALPRVGMARRVVPIEGGALVAGALLVRVEARGALPYAGRGIHGGAVQALAPMGGSTGTAVALITERGGLIVVPAEGQAMEANGWQRLAEGPVVDVVADGQRVWVRTSSGALVRSDDGARTWQIVAPSGVIAMTVSDGGAPVFVQESAAGELVVTRGDARDAWGAALPPLACQKQGSAVTLRARGPVVGVCAFGAGVYRARDGGAWERVEGTSNATAMALVDDAGTAIVALHSVAEDRAWIARAAADNVARIVAEIGGDADDGEDPRVLDLAWDDRERLAWAVGPFGLAVLRSR